VPPLHHQAWSKIHGRTPTSRESSATKSRQSRP
jgi:hypothetical protein